MPSVPNNIIRNATVLDGTRITYIIIRILILHTAIAFRRESIGAGPDQDCHDQVQVRTVHNVIKQHGKIYTSVFHRQDDYASTRWPMTVEMRTVDTRAVVRDGGGGSVSIRTRTM